MPKWLPLTKFIKYLKTQGVLLKLFLKTVEDKAIPILFYVVSIILRMANLDGQFHLDVKTHRRIVKELLSMSAQVYSEMISIAINGRIHPEYEWHHSIGCVSLDRTKAEETGSQTAGASSTFPKCHISCYCYY